MKKNVMSLTWAAALIFVMAVGVASAADHPMFPKEVLDVWAKEAPLNQNDIDTYIKFLNFSGTAEEAVKTFQDAGLTQERYGLVSTKITSGMMLAMGMSVEDLGMKDFPAVVIPSGTEIDLIKANLPKIQEAAAKSGASY